MCELASTDSGLTNEQREFDLRTEERPLLGSVPGILPYVALAAFAWSYLSVQWRWLFFIPAIYMAMKAVHSRRESARIAIGPHGIGVGRQVATWEALTSIRTAGPRRLALWYALPNPQSLWSALRGHRGQIVLPYAHEVFEEILPAVQEHRPDLAIPGRLKRCLADPQAALRTRRWPAILPALIGLGLGVWLAAMPLLDLRWLSVALPITFVGVYNAVLLGLFVTPDHYRHVSAAALAAPAAGAAVMAAAFCGMPLPAMYAVSCPVAGLWLAAAAALALRLPTSLKLDVALVALSVGVGAAAYAISSRGTWPREDITVLFGGSPPIPPMMWSADGTMMSDFANCADKALPIANRETRQTWELPASTDSLSVWWLDNRRVVYMLGGSSAGLFCYKLQENREIPLSAKRPSRSWHRPVDPGGKRVCWLEAAEPELLPAVHVWDFEREDGLQVPLAWVDEDQAVDWKCVDWADETSLVLEGYDPGWREGYAQPRRLHVIVAGLDGQLLWRWTSEQPYHEWRRSPDGRGGFARGTAEDATKGVYFIDFATGERVNLGGEDLPRWQTDGQHAYRISVLPGKGRFLWRFDRAAGRETPVLPLAEETALVSLSPRGRFALLSAGNTRFQPHIVAEVATGRRHRLQIVNCFGFLQSEAWFGPWAGYSHWSPDERQFVIETFSPSAGEPSIRVHLFDVPPDWSPAH